MSANANLGGTSNGRIAGDDGATLRRSTLQRIGFGPIFGRLASRFLTAKSEWAEKHQAPAARLRRALRDASYCQEAPQAIIFLVREAVSHSCASRLPALTVACTSG